MKLCFVVGLLVFGCGGNDTGFGNGRRGTGGDNPDAGVSGGNGAGGSKPGSGGAPACRDGDETCACYGNGTCNAGLVCASNLCVRLSSGTGGRGAGGISSVAGAGGAISNGGIPSTGGTPPTPGSSPLGGRCVQNADCRPGLSCLTAGSNALAGGGPPGGLCTSLCVGDGDCTAFDANSICVQFGTSSTSWFCLQGCTVGSTSVAKCGGRTDMVCADLIDQAGNPTVPACQPQCASDLDCPGRRCDFRTGFCADRPAGTLPIGSSCDPSASTDSCDGFCRNFYDTGPVDPRYGVCLGVCSLNLDGSGCGVDATSAPPFDTQCLGPSTAAAGDSGLCFQLCNCNGDCRNTAFICRPWADTESAAATGRAGYCRGPVDDQGLLVPDLPCGP